MGDKERMVDSYLDELAFSFRPLDFSVQRQHDQNSCGLRFDTEC